jgi:hypothetical protein
MIHIAYIIPILKVDMSLPFLARFPDVDHREQVLRCEIYNFDVLRVFLNGF